MEYDSTQPPPLPPPEPVYKHARPSYSNPPPPPSAAGRRGGLWSNFFPSCLVAGCATILAPVILVGGLLVIAGIVFSSGMDEAFSAFGDGASETVMTVTLRPGSGGELVGDALVEKAIAVVNLQGTIAGNGSPLDGDGSMAFVAEQLRLAAKDVNVKGVILQIDSPGGGLTASDHLHHEVAELRKTGKPVFAWAGSMMASGGYYVAVAADQIMASPTATVGSIGVILQHVQVEELLTKLGIKVNPVTSGERKDLGSPFREMTPEERKILQDYIDNAHSRFVDIVAAGRGLTREEVEVLADGSIMGADAALEKGLVDSIGYIDDAVALLESELGEHGMKIIGYRRMFSFEDMFTRAGANAASAAVETLRDAGASAKAMTVY